jgi:hypothetical protein
MAGITDELAVRQQLKDDFLHYAPRCLKIRGKSGEIFPFVVNKAQAYVHNVAERQLRQRGYVRIITLKGRQQGISTYIGGRYYWKVSHRKGVRVFILTHEAEATTNLFDMVDRYHDNCPMLVRPTTEANNGKELKFGTLDSGYKLGTAGTKGAGRSQTIQYFHGSEVAFWPHASTHLAGVMQAIPQGALAAGTEVFLESTANGVGNVFHKLWQEAERGQSEYEAVFLPWYWQPEYRMPVPDDFKPDEAERALVDAYGLDPAQLAWRRAKISQLSGEVQLFQQEYPNTAAEAFIASTDASFIPVSLVQKARHTVIDDTVGAILMGVDVARYGEDATAICLRIGRKVVWMKRWHKKSTMETVGIVVTLLREFNPRRIFIDVVGVGAGVVDRLREMGYSNIVQAVNSAESPLDGTRYYNKRAEMWGEMKEWLMDSPASLPDSDTLQADLCGLSYTFDSKGRYVLEKKEDARKRGIKSPDEADCLALTFAENVPAYDNDSFEPGQ